MRAHRAVLGMLGRGFHLAQAFCRDEGGATMVEYGLMVALIAVVCAAAVAVLGTALNTKFTAANDCINTPGAGNCP